MKSFKLTQIVLSQAGTPCQFGKVNPSNMRVQVSPDGVIWCEPKTVREEWDVRDQWQELYNQGLLN